MAETSDPFLSDDACGRCFLEDTAHFRSPQDKKGRSLCLTETVLEHTDAGGSSSLLHLGDVVGARATTAPGKGGGAPQHKLEVFAYVPSGRTKKAGCASVGLCRKHQRKAAHETWLASDAEIAAQWATAINDILKGDRAGGGGENGRVSGPGRHLLVLVNPVSGTGSSLSAWERTLRPILEQAVVNVTPIISTRRGELAEIIKDAGRKNEGVNGTVANGIPGAGIVAEDVTISRVASLDDFDGIVVVGGDGTFFEVLQGLYARPDCARQLSRLALGVVPTGSGNGLAKTLSEESGEEFGAVGSSFLAAKGATKELDLVPTESGDKKYLAFMNVGWGMISDVDIESEAYRWVGSLRFTLGTVIRIANLKHYRGRISFLPAMDETADSAASSTASTAPFRMPPLTDSVHSLNATVERGVSESWTSVEGSFVLADIAQTKYISHDMPMAPSSRLGDGLMDLFFVMKGASRIAMIKMFLAMEKGEHLGPGHPCVSWHRVRAFRIEPLTASGKLTVDGELVDYAPLQQHIWRKAANVMCSRDSLAPTADRLR